MNQIPWTFKTWIANFESVDLPIGDLARDVARSEGFPEEDYFGELLDFIGVKCGYNSPVIETFVLAWGYYLASKDPSGPVGSFTSL